MFNKDSKYILAIDLGTTGAKSALVSTWAEVIDFEFEETHLNLLPDGGAEQNPDEWWDAILKSSKRLLDKKLVPVDDIVAVSCTTQWSGTVAVDRDGNHFDECHHLDGLSGKPIHQGDNRWTYKG